MLAKLLLAGVFLLLGCEQDPPKKPQQDENSDDAYRYETDFSSRSSDPFGSSSFGSTGYTDPSNSGSMQNSTWGTTDSFNSNTSPYDYGPDTNCDHLYGQNSGMNGSFSNGTQNSINNGLQNGMNNSNSFQQNSQFGSPLADCQRFGNSGEYQNYGYQDPNSYNPNSFENQQQRYYEKMLDNQRDMALLQMIPSLLGIFTGTQNTQQQGLNFQQQNQFQNPQFNTPGVGMSGFNGQFGNFQNTSLPMPVMNPTNPNTQTFNQYGNTFQNNNLNQNYSNQRFFNDPNMANGLSGQNSNYNWQQR